MFVSSLQELKQDIEMVINGGLNHAVVTKSKASNLLLEIEKLEMENAELKQKLKRINDLSREF
jgi:hypothetical protein